MKTYLDCIPCFMQQALRTARMATVDEHKVKAVLDAVGDMVKALPMENTPPETGNVIYQKIREITEITDPYEEIKQANIQEALQLYPQLKEGIEKSDDPLLSSIRIAIAGNVIDFGVHESVNILEAVHTILQQIFGIFDYSAFKDQLKNARSVLYLGDNAGESVFDRLLIEQLNKPVTFVTREIPVINDCTIADAVASGIDQVAEIVSSGSPAPATILNLCNNDFLKKFKEFDFVISKGQGNYEGLSGVNRSIFFLLKAKCKVIANDLNVQENDIVLKGINLNTS